MKKLIVVLVVVFAGALFSCEPERTSEELLNEQSIDKDFPCTPSDRNCDGVPDSEQ